MKYIFIILTLSFNILANDCLNQKDEMGFKWASGPIRKQGGGWIWFLGKGEDNNPYMSSLKAKGAALNSLKDECQIIPSSAKFIENCTERSGDKNKTYTRVSVRQKSCNKKSKKNKILANKLKEYKRLSRIRKIKEKFIPNNEKLYWFSFGENKEGYIVTNFDRCSLAQDGNYEERIKNIASARTGKNLSNFSYYPKYEEKDKYILLIENKGKSYKKWKNYILEEKTNKIILQSYENRISRIALFNDKSECNSFYKNMKAKGMITNIELLSLKDPKAYKAVEKHLQIKRRLKKFLNGEIDLRSKTKDFFAPEDTVD